MSLRVKPIKGFENYTIDTLGRVWSIKNETYLVKCPNWDGYNQVCLRKNGNGYTKRVCRLVAIHFIPNPNGYPCVNHVDLEKANDKIENLEWCTYQQNNLHSLYHPTMSKYRRYMFSERLNKRKRIIAIKDGKKYEFLGIKPTAKLLNIPASTIHKALNESGKVVGGYVWARA